jgi:hypothetical protein
MQEKKHKWRTVIRIAAAHISSRFISRLTAAKVRSTLPIQVPFVENVLYSRNPWTDVLSETLDS